MNMVIFPICLLEDRVEVGAYGPEGVPEHRVSPVGEDATAILRHKDQMRVKGTNNASSLAIIGFNIASIPRANYS